MDTTHQLIFSWMTEIADGVVYTETSIYFACLEVRFFAMSIHSCIYKKRCIYIYIISHTKLNHQSLMRQATEYCNILVLEIVIKVQIQLLPLFS